MTDRPKAPEAQGQKRPRSEVARWNHAVREAYARTDPDASAMAEGSDEDLERVLREAGVDLAAEDAKADATYEAAIAKFGRDHANASAPALARTDLGPSSPARARVVPLRSRPRWIVESLPHYVAAAAVIGAVLVQSAGLFGAAPRARPSNPENVAPTRAEIAQAVGLRERATKECERREWTNCRATLDQARKYDEDGEAGFDVHKLRRAINDGIAADEFENSLMRPRK